MVLDGSLAESCLRVSGINFLDHQLNSFVFLLWVGLYPCSATSSAPWNQKCLPLLVSLPSCVALQFKPFKHRIMEFSETSLAPGSFSTSSQVSGRISTPMSGQPATTLPEKTTGRAFQRPSPCESIDELEETWNCELEFPAWSWKTATGSCKAMGGFF